MLKFAFRCSGDHVSIPNGPMDARQLEANLDGTDLSVELPTLNVDRVVLCDAQSTQQTHVKMQTSTDHDHQMDVNNQEDIECARKVSEESVIASQTHTHCFSSKGNGVKVGIVNKEDGNSPHEDHMASEIEGSPVIAEDISSILMSPHNIKHAASELHPPSLTVCWRNTQEDTSERENDQSDTVLAESTNVISIGCSSLKEFLDSKFYSIPLLRESCDSDKSSTNVSDEYDTNTQTTVTVEETNKSLNFPPQFSSGENTINFNYSHNLVDFDQNLENKNFYPLKHCENEMDFINSEETYSDNQTCTAKTSTLLRDDCKAKKSFFSKNIQLKNHHALTKMKPDSPNEVKVIDEYDENSSGSFSQNLIYNSSLDELSSDDISMEVIETHVSQSENSNLHSVTPVINNTPLQTSDSIEIIELLSDDSSDYEQYLNPKTFWINKEQENHITDEYDLPDEDGYLNLMPCVINGIKEQSIPVEEGIISLDPESSNHCVTIMDADSVGTCIRKKKASDAFRNKEILIGEFSNEPYSLKPFSIGNLQDQARTDKTNLTDEDEHVNLMSSCSTNKVKTQNTPIEKVISLRSKSSDNLVKSVEGKDLVCTYDENTDDRIRKICDDFLNMIASYENIVKPHQSTCESKMRSPLKTSDSVEIIELSSDDFSDIEQYSNQKTCVNKEHENFITDQHDLPDDDGYVNLMPSCVLIESESQSVPVEERIISLEPESLSKAQGIPVEERTISLEPESTEILDLVAEAKDSTNFCCNTFFTETFCKSTKTERPENNVPKSSSHDVAKVKALKKRVREVSPVYRKRVSNKRKVIRNVKKCRNTAVSIVHDGQQSKDKKSESILHSICPPVRGKNCNIKFLDSSTKNCCDIDEQNTLTSTQGSIVEYACDNCNFASRIVNNLIIHRKYCKIKSTVDMLDSEGENIEDYESSYDTIDNIILDTEKKNLEVLLYEMKSGSPIYFRFPVRHSTSRIPEK